jgi:hypothetical protein
MEPHRGSFGGLDCAKVLGNNSISETARFTAMALAGLYHCKRKTHTGFYLDCDRLKLALDRLIRNQIITGVVVG